MLTLYRPRSLKSEIMRTKIFSEILKWKKSKEIRSSFYSPQKKCSMVTNVGTIQSETLQERGLYSNIPIQKEWLWRFGHCHVWADCRGEIAVSNLNLLSTIEERVVQSIRSIAIGFLISRPWTWNRAYVERDYPDDPKWKKRPIPAMSLMDFMVLRYVRFSYVQRNQKIRRDYSHYFER